MNQESYQLLCDLQEFIERKYGTGYLVSFTCPGEYFRFEVVLKSDNCTVIYFRWMNYVEPKYIKSFARVIKTALAFKEVKR